MGSRKELIIPSVHESFTGGIDSRWRSHAVGVGSLEPGTTTLRFVLTGATTLAYSNAQLDDYQGLPRRSFLWRPPLKLTVRARFSHPAEQLQGTAGFGFWNDPFLMTEKRIPALPRAIWFFYASRPSNIKLDLEAPGHGWKAATLDAQRPAALQWALSAPLVVPLMNLPPAYRTLWPPIQRALKVSETSLDVNMTRWHTYMLEWGAKRSRFSVAAEGTLPPTPMWAAPSPEGPLGFVMWLDNQYLIATPWGQLRWGLLAKPDPQWMEVDWLVIDTAADPNHG
jgi:hypothetical protein